MTDQELDEILTFRWPGIVRRVMGDTGTDGFTRGFVRSIARNGKCRRWHPTAAQERIMRKMLVDYTGPPDPEPELIERD